MTHRTTALWATLALLTSCSFAFAQRDGDRPEDRDRGPRDGQRGPRDGDGPPFGRGFRPPPNPVVEAIDADGDGELSASEIEGAVAALRKLDKDSDGVIGRDEMRPDFSRMRREARRPGDRFGRFGDRDRSPGDADRPRGERDRPPRDGDRPRPDTDRPRGDGDRPSGGRFGGGDRGPGGRGFGFGRPEIFVDRMMASDTDGNGKLSREELMKAAEGFRERRGRFGRNGDGPDRSERPDRPE